MPTFFKDKIITVIGGSSGMGRELVRQLAAQGAIVVIGARNPETATSLVDEQRAKGGKVSFLPIDVQQAEQCERFFAAVMQHHGRLDYAFNCAGIIMAGEVRDNQVDDIRSLLTTNVLGMTYCAFYAYRIMAQQGFGHIINFSSGGGIFPLPLMGVYSASKFAVYGLCEALRIEGRGLGVKVSAVAPGLVDTPIYDTAVYSKTDKQKSKKLLQQPLYMIQPDRAARTILRGTRRGKAVIETQFYVRTTWWAYRAAPWLYHFVLGRTMGTFRRRFRSAQD